MNSLSANYSPYATLHSPHQSPGAGTSLLGDGIRIRVQHQMGGHRLDIDFALPGRCWGVFGPSGAGKTTLLNLIAGFEQPVAGVIRYGDRVVFDSNQRVNTELHRRGIGYVFQDFRLFPHLSIRGNLEFANKLAPSERQFFGIDEIARMLEIDHLLDRGITSLSGGEKQRITIARTLLSGPELLLLDEPLKGLDTKRKNRLLLFFRRLIDEYGMAILLVSHDLNSVFTLTDKLVLIDKGTSIAAGSYLDLLHKPEAVQLLHSTKRHGVGLGNR